MRYLRSDRWHTVTIAADTSDRTAAIYLDGVLAMEREINIGAGGGHGIEGPSKMGPVSALELFASNLVATLTSPYAVPQAGFLLFASSNARGMPGGLMLRRITFHNTMLGAQQVEEQYLNSRSQKQPKQAPQQLALSPALKKAAPLLWHHASFLCEFADCFIGSADGDCVHFLRAFLLGLEGAAKSLSDSPAGGLPLWTPDNQSTLLELIELFQRSEPLFRKWNPLSHAEEDSAASLSASYIRRLQVARQSLRTSKDGAALLIPLCVKTLDAGMQSILLILERRDIQTYRLTVINSGSPGLEWHACSSAQPPGMKYQAALCLDDIPASKAEDDAFWAVLVLTLSVPPSPMMAKEPLPLYDKLLPWLI